MSIRSNKGFSYKYFFVICSIVSICSLYILFKFYENSFQWQFAFLGNNSTITTTACNSVSLKKEINKSQISLFYRHATSERNSSYPFISGDTFRALADYVYDETKQDDLTRLKYGDIIFIKADMIRPFFTSVFDSIKQPFVLVTHNSDVSAPNEYAKHLSDSKILIWYASNPSEYNHSKVSPIPIGLANTRWPHGNLDKVMYAYKNHRKSWSQRTNLLYVNFDISTNSKERKQALSQASSIENVHIVKDRISFETYLEQLGNTKFILSPRGNGLDCHRTWESIIMGAVPIVLKSTLDSLLSKTRTVILDDWSKLTQTLLFSLDFSQNDQVLSDYVNASYWRETLLKHRNIVK